MFDIYYFISFSGAALNRWCSVQLVFIYSGKYTVVEIYPEFNKNSDVK